MFRSLRYQAEYWPIVWRIRLFICWLEDHLAVFAMVGLPVVVLGSIVLFVYADQMRVAHGRRRAADLRCLAENIYFEARSEPLAGQHAVAEVTLNRVESWRFPDTVCEVVHEARWDRARKRRIAAFSWTQLKDTHQPRGAAWQKAIAAATAVYDGKQAPVVSGALFYHTTSIYPYWAREKEVVATIANHVFYR
jgi:spore germination cell wall hydrolase CwlJ-like protein